MESVRDIMSEKKEYRPLTIPRLTWDKKTISETYGELVAQPLQPGFGMTLGNSLRRVLLGGVEGAAVTSVIIHGVNNEFAIVPGIVEDSMQLCLNIKQIVVKSKDGLAGTMRLKVDGEKTVTVADIELDDNLELINVDHVLAHVAANGSLDIEFIVEPGRGYQTAQWPEGKALQENDKIYLDSMFSPITKVTFDISKTRVGNEIDYDKLVIQIHTDGSENPLDALHYAVSVLRTQLEHFLASAEIPFNEISALPEEEKQEIQEGVEDLSLKGVPVELLLKPIDELELSVRAHNCLMQANIKRIVDLVNLSEDDGLKIKNFGRKSLNEVKDSMKAFGLSFGLDIQEEDLKRVMQEHGMHVPGNE
jgi:DNA-directed RNA polymerase subunit alpha